VDPLLKQSLDWYLYLGSLPGWKAQAWHSVQALAREHPSIFWKLPELLVAEMQRRRSDEAAPSR
jgi:hypothetical protein